MKAKTFLVADTETTGIGPKAIVYDLAYAIVTRKKVLCERTFLVSEILTDPRTMLGAIDDKHWRQSFGGKIFHHYIPALNANTLKLFAWRDICEQMREDMRTYDVKVFSAYNLSFDMGALGKTQDKICSGGKVLEYKPDLLDLWEFACGTVLRSRLYHETARKYGEEFGWVTAANNVRTTAEKCYAFISGQHDFVESHTALEDVHIEIQILWRLLSRKTPIPYNIVGHMPWRKAQTLRGKMFDNLTPEKIQMDML